MTGPPAHAGREHEEYRDCLVGYQYATPDATTGVDEFSTDDRNLATRVERTRLSCVCGTVDPSDRHEVLRDIDSEATVTSLWSCLVSLEAEGALDRRPSKDRYFAALREEWRDWEYAAGRALYD
jgi:hypothetical protein